MSAAKPATLNLANIQGDILAGGFPKKTETFIFFQIDSHHVQTFRKKLTQLIPHIKSTAQVVDDRKKLAQNKKEAVEKKYPPPIIKLTGLNIAFSHKGLVQMGLKDDIGDQSFNAGMLGGAKDLGDKGTTAANGKFEPDWLPAFKKDIHGLILITGESHETVNAVKSEVKKIFSIGTTEAVIHEVLQLVGDVRPGKESGHEHFGFLDGVTQPAVKGVDSKLLPGQEAVRQGIILCGREGDGTTTRPPWALDGTFLSFRYLPQLVPEFDNFLKHNPIPNLPPAFGSELLGARLVGRWKSGAPIDITPTKDDPALGADPNRNDNFRYAFPEDQQTQDRCPFAAHTRKTNPRADLQDRGIPTEAQRIIRSGIQFGPEVTKDEAASGKTHWQRGLLFVAYQSNISQGFEFIQKSWANNTGFIFGKPVAQPGFDPIIGQTNSAGVRTSAGMTPNNESGTLNLPTQWVESKGGEYFFSPSIPALKQTFALAH